MMSQYKIFVYERDEYIGHEFLEAVDISHLVNWDMFPQVWDAISYIDQSYITLDLLSKADLYASVSARNLVNSGRYAFSPGLDWIDNWQIYLNYTSNDNYFYLDYGFKYIDISEEHQDKEILVAIASKDTNNKLVPITATNPNDSSVYLGWIVISSVYDAQGVALVNKALFNIEPVESEDEKEGEPTVPEGLGTPDYTYTHNNISFTTKPPNSVSFNEIYHVYKLDEDKMHRFNSFLWTDSMYSGFVHVMSNPMDAIILCSSFPFEVEASTSKGIILGNWDSQVPAPVVNDQFQLVNMGKRFIQYRTNTFLDTNPYAKVKIYLPYCNIYPLDPQEVLGHTIEIRYMVDILTGDIVAQVATDAYSDTAGEPNHVILEATGNIANNISLSAEKSNRLANTLMGFTSGLVSGGGKGAAAGAISGMIQKDEIGVTGKYAGSTGLLAEQNPYIMVDHYKHELPGRYTKYKGRPANVTDKVKNFSNFLRVDECRINFDCPTEVKNNILNKLKAGIIIKK